MVYIVPHEVLFQAIIIPIKPIIHTRSRVTNYLLILELLIIVDLGLYGSSITGVTEYFSIKEYTNGIQGDILVAILLFQNQPMNLHIPVLSIKKANTAILMINILSVGTKYQSFIVTDSN